MKKLAVLVTLFFLALNSSPASTAQVQKATVHPKLSVSKTRMPTKSVLVLAVPKHQRKLLVTNEIDDDGNDLPGPDELDLHVLYSRPRVVENHQELNDDDLSDYVTVRLAIARAKAMAKYKERWGTA